MAKHQIQRYLYPEEVEKEFMLVMYYLNAAVVLDGIEVLTDLPGFRISTHDPHGPLPDAIIHDTGDRYPVLEAISMEGAKRVAVTWLRREMVKAFLGVSFLPPTRLDKRCVVGIQWEGKTVLAEASDFVQAYHRLWRHAVRRFL